MNAMNSESKANNAGLSTHLIRVVAWVEIMGRRAETTFDVESPLVCEGAYPVLQRKSDEGVAAWLFLSQCKSGFTVSPVSSPSNSVE